MQQGVDMLYFHWWSSFETISKKTPGELVTQSPGPSGTGQRTQSRSLGSGGKKCSIADGVARNRDELSLEQLKDTISERPHLSGQHFTGGVPDAGHTPGLQPIVLALWLHDFCYTMSCLDSWISPDVPKDGPDTGVELLRSGSHVTNRKWASCSLNTHRWSFSSPWKTTGHLVRYVLPH